MGKRPVMTAPTFHAGPVARRPPRVSQGVGRGSPASLLDLACNSTQDRPTHEAIERRSVWRSRPYQSGGQPLDSKEYCHRDPDTDPHRQRLDARGGPPTSASPPTSPRPAPSSASGAARRTSWPRATSSRSPSCGSAGATWYRPTRYSPYSAGSPRSRRTPGPGCSSGVTDGTGQPRHLPLCTGECHRTEAESTDE